MSKFIKKHIPLLIVLGFILLIVLLTILSSLNPPRIDSDLIRKWNDSVMGKDYTVTVFAQTTCSHCKNYKPVIEELQSTYNFKLYFLDVDTYSSNDRNFLNNKFKYKDYNGTPYTFITKDGKIIYELSGETTKSVLENILVSNNVISK